jgi:hypothetical protein
MPGDPIAKVLSLSLPRRDRAYIVGPHGMVYRYRVVPANYTVANAFDAPLMPAFGAAELSVKADAVRRDIEVLRGKLGALPGGPQSSGASATGDQSASVGTAASGTSASGQPSAADNDQSAGPSGAAATGGFVQDTDVSATANAIANGDSGSGSAAFTQDTSPPSDVFTTCCAAAVQQLQADTSGFVMQIPSVTSQLRPLNLMIAGLQLAATLMNQGHGLWSQFKALKHAPNAQAAAQALQQLSTALNSVQQTSSSGLQNPGAWFAANAPATFTQDVGSGPSGAGAALGNAISGSAAATAQSGTTPQGASPQSGARRTRRASN